MTRTNSSSKPVNEPLYENHNITVLSNGEQEIRRVQELMTKSQQHFHRLNLRRTADFSTSKPNPFKSFTNSNPPEPTDKIVSKVIVNRVAFTRKESNTSFKSFGNDATESKEHYNEDLS